MITRKRPVAGACALLAALAAGLVFPAGAAAGEPAGGVAPTVNLLLDVRGSMRAQQDDLTLPVARLVVWNDAG